ncbi:MAG: 3-dehydroquinate synthase [Gammaproteobacteria bacterium]|nr:3-dehydroquinate synthase [Gammaproteobacteria bacterium]
MSGFELAVEGIDYPVWVGAREEIDDRLNRLIAGRDLLVVTDGNVASVHLESFRASFASAARLETLVLPPGESEKTLAGFERIIAALVAGRFHRDAVVVALGGGVVGDTAGFAAACYQRGVDWIAVPTTLLAQVDAALGGKTAVNHPAGKNLVGAFHDPVAVWIDPATLASLPPRELRAGFGEVVKYGLGFDAGFFAWLEDHAEALGMGEQAGFAAVVEHCARIKLKIVAADRTEHSEQGGRVLLNLGHTLGHALETALGHGYWLHGEAVAVGLVVAAELSRARRRIDPDLPTRLRRLLHALHLPAAIPDALETESLMQGLALDKKIAGGRLRFVGLEAPGRAVAWNDVAADELEQAIDAARTRP